MIYRGCQIGPDAYLSEVQTIESYGANIIRYQIAPEPVTSEAAWKMRVMECTGKLRSLALNMPSMNFVADLHKVPDIDRLMHINWAWKEIHGQVGKLKNVIWYGILNEPPVKSFSVCKEIMFAGIDAVTQSTAKRFALTFPYSDPPHFVKGKPFRDVMGVEVKNALYEVHMYLPLNFTHQGIYEYPAGKRYPDGSLNKEWLKNVLHPVRAFQLNYKKDIFVGEFSVSNFAEEESRINYLRALLDIFEHYRWSWCYHALYESPVWSPSLKVLDLLKNYWKKNI